MHCKRSKRLCTQEKTTKVRDYRDNLIMQGDFPMRCHDSMLRHGLPGPSKFQGKAGTVTFTEFIEKIG